MKKRVLITGASGKIGPALVSLLLTRGYQVRVLLRKKHGLKELAASIETVYGDIRDSKVIKQAVVGVDYIFHLAALLHIQQPSLDLKDEYYDVNVNGTRIILKEAQLADVKRVVFFSTISVYGPGKQGMMFTEKSQTFPKTMYARTKYEAESLALNFTTHSQNKSLVTVLRLASVYGQRMTGNYLSLIRAVENGFFLFPGKEDVFRTLVHERDVAEGAILAARHPAAAGKVYNLTDGAIHTVRDIVGYISHALDRRCLTMNLPGAPLSRLTKMIERDPTKYGHLISSFGYKLSKLMENMAVSGDKIRDELGFKPQYDMTCGWFDALNQKKDDRFCDC